MGSEIKVWERKLETKQGVETNRLLDIDRIGKEELGLKPILLKEAGLRTFGVETRGRNHQMRG